MSLIHFEMILGYVVIRGLYTCLHKVFCIRNLLFILMRACLSVYWFICFCFCFKGVVGIGGCVFFSKENLGMGDRRRNTSWYLGLFFIQLSFFFPLLLIWGTSISPEQIHSLFVVVELPCGENIRNLSQKSVWNQPPSDL